MRKAIYTTSRLRNNFWKNLISEKERLYKDQRNKSVSLRKNCIKTYFEKVTGNGIATNKVFWEFIKPF